MALALLLGLTLAPAAALGQDGQGEPPAEEPPATLDDLLGLEEEAQDESEAAAERAADEELQRRLDEDAISDAFAEAVQKMTLSAELLDEKFDTGLGTQRIQEEIIRKLDQLIDFARQQQGAGASSSSSSSSQQQQSSSQSPGRQQGAAGQAGNERNRSPSDSQEGDPPAMQQGDINQVFEETRSEWGNLPERIRDELMQGRREKYSSLYERLTVEYYRRLAEEGTP